MTGAEIFRLISLRLYVNVNLHQRHADAAIPNSVLMCNTDVSATSGTVATDGKAPKVFQVFPKWMWNAVLFRRCLNNLLANKQEEGTRSSRLPRHISPRSPFPKFHLYTPHPPFFCSPTGRRASLRPRRGVETKVDTAVSRRRLVFCRRVSARKPSSTSLFEAAFKAAATLPTLI